MRKYMIFLAMLVTALALAVSSAASNIATYNDDPGGGSGPCYSDTCIIYWDSPDGLCVGIYFQYMNWVEVISGPAVCNWMEIG